MKIKTKELKEFLKKALMENEQQIDECILDFSPEGLKISATDAPGQAKTTSWLKTSGFKEYEAIEKVGMNDLKTVIKVLDRFGEFISLKKEGNLLTIAGESDGSKKSVGVELIAEDYIKAVPADPKLEWDETFSIPAKLIKDAIADVKMNKDAVLTFTTKEKMVEISNTGKYKFRNNIPAPTSKGGTVVTFGAPFINAVQNLDGVIEFNMKSDYPVKIMEKTEHAVVSFIVAPRVESGE